MGILYFIILVAILIFVHEYGHYIVAKLFKVKILNFSVGFGPKAFSFMRGETEWTVRWLPLGGYVQMLGHDPSDPVPQEEQHRSFQFKPLWQRALIILAGPVFNLLFPIPIFWAMTMATKDAEPPPVVGQIVADEPAEGKLQPGDEIIAINGEEIRLWHELVDIVSDAAGEPLTFTVKRDDTTLDVEITPAEKHQKDLLGLAEKSVGRIGITLEPYAPIVGVSDPTGPAALAGLQTFDEIAAVNGEPVRTFLDLERALRATPEGSSAELFVLRAEPLDVSFGQLGLNDLQTVTITPEMRDGKRYTGLESAEMYILQVDPGSPAELAGLQRGDRILSLDGKPFNNPSSLRQAMANNHEQAHTLRVRRGTTEMDLSIQLKVVDIIGEYKEERPILLSGFHHLLRYEPAERRELTFGERFAYASYSSLSITYEASTALVMGLYRMAEGRVSTKSIGGPIMIGQMASKAGSKGIEFFLQMMCFISINLGIVNLLPIPMLDGGHLMIFGVEAIKRGPLSMRTRQIISFVGLAIVIFLMLFAFKNDIERYWSDIVGMIV